MEECWPWPNRRWRRHRGRIPSHEAAKEREEHCETHGYYAIRDSCRAVPKHDPQGEMWHSPSAVRDRVGDRRGVWRGGNGPRHSSHPDRARRSHRARGAIRVEYRAGEPEPSTRRRPGRSWIRHCGSTSFCWMDGGERRRRRCVTVGGTYRDGCAAGTKVDSDRHAGRHRSIL